MVQGKSAHYNWRLVQLAEVVVCYYEFSTLYSSVEVVLEWRGGRDAVYIR